MKKTKKLKLGRETLRLLDASDLEQAQGQGLQATNDTARCPSIAPTYGSCYNSCNPTCRIAACLTNTYYC